MTATNKFSDTYFARRKCHEIALCGVRLLFQGYRFLRFAYRVAQKIQHYQIIKNRIES